MDEVFEVSTLNYELYTMAFAAIENEIDDSVKSATKLAIMQSFTLLLGFDDAEFSAGKFLDKIS